MSFSSEVKNELCRQSIGKKCCALAEAYGALLYGNCFSASLIRFITASETFAQRLPKLFTRAFGVDFDRVETAGKYSLVITDTDKISHIFEAFGYDAASLLAHHINRPLVENECDRQAFVRGAFLAGGSVTDPTRRYHLELATAHASVCRETHALLLEMGFEPKDARRGGVCLTYFKQSTAIEDLLTTIGAPLGAMELMQAKVEKDMTNAMNRLTNCDMANADKVTRTAAGQLAAIRAIEAGPGLDSLPPALQETALLRIANPACSLADLAQLSFPPVTKSCMAHRLRKLAEYAQKIEM